MFVLNSDYIHYGELVHIYKVFISMSPWPLFSYFFFCLLDSFLFEKELSPYFLLDSNAFYFGFYLCLRFLIYDIEAYVPDLFHTT